MQISEIYKKIHEFTVLATGYDQSKVVFANQLSNSRPKKPFITISINKFRNNGTPIIKNMQDSGLQETVVSMLFNVMFQSYSDKVHEAENTLENLHIKLSTELAQDVFQCEIATRKSLITTQSLPLALNEQNESRAVLEVEMSFNKTTHHEVGLIEEIIVDGLLDEHKQEIIIR